MYRARCQSRLCGPRGGVAGRSGQHGRPRRRGRRRKGRLRTEEEATSEVKPLVGGEVTRRHTRHEWSVVVVRGRRRSLRRRRKRIRFFRGRVCSCPYRYRRTLSKHLQEDFKHDADGRPTQPGSLICGKGCCLCRACAMESFERAPQTITLEQLTQSGGHLICRGEECVNQTELYDYADLTATPDLVAASGKLYKFFLEEGEKNRLQMLEKVAFLLR